MLRSRWEKLYEMVYDKFGIKEESKKEIEVKKGVRGRQEQIVFITPKGKMRLERLIKPKFEGVKFRYSRRTSRAAYQEIKYSSDETVEIIRLYQWDEKGGGWKELNLTDL